MCLQVEAHGPGLEKTGCLVNQLAEFTVSAKDAGKGPLKILAQVRCRNPCCVTGCISPAFFPCAHIALPLSGRGGASCGGEGEEQGRRRLRLLLHAGLISQTHLGHHLGWSQHPQKPLQGKQPIAARGHNGILCSVQIQAPN